MVKNESIESGERVVGYVPARLVTVGVGKNENDEQRLARRTALLRASVRAFDGLADNDLKLLAMCLEQSVVGECEPLLRCGEYPSSLMVIEAGEVECMNPGKNTADLSIAGMYIHRNGYICALLPRESCASTRVGKC